MPINIRCRGIVDFNIDNSFTPNTKTPFFGFTPRQSSLVNLIFIKLHYTFYCLTKNLIYQNVDRCYNCFSINLCSLVGELHNLWVAKEEVLWSLSEFLEWVRIN